MTRIGGKGTDKLLFELRDVTEYHFLISFFFHYVHVHPCLPTR